MVHNSFCVLLLFFKGEEYLFVFLQDLQILLIVREILVVITSHINDRLAQGFNNSRHRGGNCLLKTLSHIIIMCLACF